MTPLKTSVEILESRNEKVSDEHSALIATRWKWREIETKALELWNLVDHSCGMCKLAMTRRDKAVIAMVKCDHCPTQVSEFCQDLQRSTTEIEALLDEELDSVMEFLEGLKAEELAEDKGVAD